MLVEFVAFFLSVKPGNRAARKLHFRMVKTKILNEQQNNEMWSTDDEVEDDIEKGDSHANDC